MMSPPAYPIIVIYKILHINGNNPIIIITVVFCFLPPQTHPHQGGIYRLLMIIVSFKAPLMEQITRGNILLPGRRVHLGDYEIEDKVI